MLQLQDTKLSLTYDVNQMQKHLKPYITKTFLSWSVNFVDKQAYVTSIWHNFLT